jgi:hypothetical protein
MSEISVGGVIEGFGPSSRSYTTIDKSAWGDGLWNAEPDKVQWVDAATNLDCLIVRNRLGTLCGYVGVMPGHPWHGESYEGLVREPDEDEWDAQIDTIIEVHGGLTYASSCNEDAAESEGICHVPLPGRAANVWWFGFDCGHSGDVIPGMRIDWPGGSYKTVAYVRRECESLARQLVTV